MDGSEVKVPSQGQVNLNTVLGAVGSYGALSGGFNNCGGGILGGIFGGNRNGNGCGDQWVTRYEVGMQQALAAKDSEIMELKANIYTDSKITDTYKELRGLISVLQEFAARQAIQNQGFTDAFREIQKDIDYKLNLEAERRECADCSIVNYLNSNFATKLIQPYAAGTEAGSPASTFNPLACTKKGCGC
jgi:hypothetical protein